MGEIADALRRAHEEHAEGKEVDAPRRRARRPSDDVYSESARRHETDEPAPATSPRASDPAAADAEAVQLTHRSEGALVRQGVLVDEGGAVTDACLQLALRVRKATTDLNARTIVVTSAVRNEGKTTVSCNLALALASLGQADRVALVDLDLRRPSLLSALELPSPRAGIEEVVSGARPLEDALVRIASPRLDVYPCVRGQLKAHELLLQSSFTSVLEALRQRYEAIVIDTPPALVVPDATIIMEHADCYIPVARAGVTRARNLRRMLDTLPRHLMLGPVLDCAATTLRKGYYHHYGPDTAVEGDAHG